MNSTDQLERDLSAWFADTAAPRLPDFTDHVLNLTAGTDQRPRWSFPERWIPMSVITLGRRTFKPLPWRTIGLLAALAILIAAAVAVYVGSQPRLPAPFGLAANGVVAYAKNGDIFAVDPISGARQAIAIGPESDREPRFSRDGTRVAFLRSTGARLDVLAIATLGRNEVVTTAEQLVDIDSDSIAWSPDSRSVAIVGTALARGIYIVDATTGATTPLATQFEALDLHWRPPDGRELMVFGGNEPGMGLYLLDVADGKVTGVAVPDDPGARVRLSGWTPDGQRFVYMRGDDGIPFRTHVLDMSSDEEVVIDAAFAHVSNDGSRLVALDDQGRVCVASIDGGPCNPISEPAQAYEGTTAAAAQWSPNDEWILSRPQEGRAVILDPDGGSQDQPSWIADGAESWQRLAP
jgi:Tol biopolymer transport system component